MATAISCKKPPPPPRWSQLLTRPESSRGQVLCRLQEVHYIEERGRLPPVKPGIFYNILNMHHGGEGPSIHYLLNMHYGGEGPSYDLNNKGSFPHDYKRRGSKFQYK